MIPPPQHMAEEANERTSYICSSLSEHRVDTCHCCSKLIGQNQSNCHDCLQGGWKMSFSTCLKGERAQEIDEQQECLPHVQNVCQYINEINLTAKTTQYSNFPLTLLILFFSLFFTGLCLLYPFFYIPKVQFLALWSLVYILSFLEI